MIRTHAVVLTASDTANTDTITITVTVVDVNDAPTVSSEISDATIDEDSAYSLDVSGNFADADSDTLTFTASGLPSSGNLAMSGAGTFQYSTTSGHWFIYSRSYCYR